MELIYVVTTGSYSDYEVRGVFNDIELANSYMKEIEDEYANDILTLEMNEGYTPDGFIYKVTMDRDGNSIYSSSKHIVEVENGVVGEYKIHRRYIGGDRSKPINHFTIHVRAKSKKHAIKIANEKRIQLIAENKFEVTE